MGYDDPDGISDDDVNAAADDDDDDDDNNNDEDDTNVVVVIMTTNDDHDDHDDGDHDDDCFGGKCVSHSEAHWQESHPFTPKSDQLQFQQHQKYSIPHSMKNLAFHSLLR